MRDCQRCEGGRPKVNLNDVFINDGMSQAERLVKLNKIAIHQMQILEDVGGKRLMK